MKGLPSATDAYRLVDSTDYTVDVFKSVAVLSLYRPYSSKDERTLSAEVATKSGCTSVYLKRRPRQAHGVASQTPEQVAPPAPVVGEPVESVEVKEGGARFQIRPGNGLSVGLYLDARDARAWVRGHSRGLKVLNLFSYTCGFGISALLGGATRAVNIDLSRKVLDWGEANTALNGFTPDRRDFISGDCFDWLARFAKKNEQFDLVVLDPPSFSNANGKRFRAETDYGELVTALNPVLAKGGTLLACCNLETLGASPLERLAIAGLGGRAKKLAAFGASAVDFTQPPAFKAVALKV